MTRKRGVPDLEFWKNLLNNAFELWFAPEIKRRQSAGLMPTPANIWGAQVIMEPDKAPQVFLNDEIQGVFAAEIADPTAEMVVGSIADVTKIRTIRGVLLTDAHPNAGHVTVVWTEGFPFIAFDFRYNAARIEVLCLRAEQFHRAARNALRHQHFSAFAENLFAEVELLAKAVLATAPDARVLRTSRHNFVRAELNRSRKHGNVPPRFSELHNQLAEVRGAARYGDVAFSIPIDDARRMLRTARDFLRYVESRRPRRWRGPE